MFPVKRNKKFNKRIYVKDKIDKPVDWPVGSSLIQNLTALIDI